MPKLVTRQQVNNKNKPESHKAAASTSGLETTVTPPPPKDSDQVAAAIPIEVTLEASTEEEFEENMKTDTFERREVVQRLSIGFMFDNTFDACEDRSKWNGPNGIRTTIKQALTIPEGTNIDFILEEVIECRNSSRCYTGETKVKKGRPCFIGLDTVEAQIIADAL
jgi:hypothetical protein